MMHTNLIKLCYLCIFSVGLLLSGCAGVDSQQIPLEPEVISLDSNIDPGIVNSWNEKIRSDNLTIEKKFKGIRYPLPSTYLLVYSNGKGKLKWELHNLPDPTKRMSTKPYNIFATLQATFTFDEQTGVLKQSKEVSDSTAVPAALLTAIQQIAPKLLALNEPGDNTFPAPALYKIVYHDGEYKFVGGHTLYPDIKVTKDVTIETPGAEGEGK